MGSPKEQTVTSKTEPWAEAKPYFTQMYQKAMEAFGATNRKPYTGKTYAAPNVWETKAAKQMAGNKWGQGAAALRKVGDYVTGQVGNTSWLNPDTNPFIKGVADTATRRATE